MAPAGRGTGLAVVDFAYVDTSGEPADQAAAHQQRLSALMTALRHDLAENARVRLVSVRCGSVPCRADLTAPADLLRAASDAGAGILVVGGIQKLSTLVQWARVQAVDLARDRVVLDRLFTFRGDGDEAWQRAELFMARELRAALQVGASAPIRLALFDFELEDVGAGAPSSAEPGSHGAHLTRVTDAVRGLFAQSGRYRLVDVALADAAPAKAHTLHDCNGCDAAIALALGAEQSLVGVVRRISQTEYLAGFQIRDARTGAVIADESSGLRMGADYSWSRGAARLAADWLARDQR